MDELKPDYQSAYREWNTAGRTPQATSQLLAQLDPVIQRGVAVYGGGKNDPLMHSRARRLALGALKSYDPRQGTRITTHVNNHLQGLRRAARRQQQVLRIPERVSFDQALLHEATAELSDRLGREPSTTELADYTHLSPDRIARVRRYQPGIAEGALDARGVDSAMTAPRSPQGHHQRVALAVHADLGPRDQQILEWSLGLFGRQKLDNHTIAARLGITPSAVSQRKLLIQQRLDQLLQGGF